MLSTSDRVAKRAIARTVPSHGPHVDSLVLFELRDGEGQSLYLLIRFYSWSDFEVEGDHLYFSLEKAFQEALQEFGVAPGDWQDLSDDERKRVDGSIRN